MKNKNTSRLGCINCHPKLDLGSRCSKRGFTLIELLVVVLIIGILASVALPQYQKAVRKARLSEVATIFNTVSRGIEMYKLENDMVSNDVPLSGTSKVATMDISPECVSEDASYCYTNIGRWRYWCSYSNCSINYDASYNADKTSGNKKLEGVYISWSQEGAGPWNMIADSSSRTAEICRWWKDLYGVDRILDSSGECAAYF